MFDIGFSELVLIALLALLVLGPKRLPEAARGAGRVLGQLRRFLTDVRQDFDRELQAAELDELRKLKQELTDTRRAIEQSSAQLHEQVAADLNPQTVPPPGETAPNAPAPMPPPLREPPKPRRPRAARSPKKNGPTKRPDGN